MGWLKDNWHWLLLIALAVGYANQWARLANQEEINAARAEARELQQAKEKLEREVDGLESQIAENQEQAQALTKQRDQALARVDEHKARIQELEEQQAERQLTVRKLRTEDDLVKKFKATYPEVSRAAGLGLVDIETNGVMIPYLAIPAWYTETFIIEHDQLSTCRQTVAEYKKIEAEHGKAQDLNQRIAELLRENFDLQQDATEKYQAGYEDAVQRHSDLTDKYISELKKPMFDFGGWGTAIACTAAGVGGLYLGTKF